MHNRITTTTTEVILTARLRAEHKEDLNGYPPLLRVRYDTVEEAERDANLLMDLHAIQHVGILVDTRECITFTPDDTPKVDTSPDPAHDEDERPRAFMPTSKK